MKIIIPVFVMLFLVSSVFAAIEPSIAWCLHNGYNGDNDANCIFDDGNKCPFQQFKDGTCGQEYVKEESEIPCRNEGESLFWETEKCCEELDPIVTKIGPLTCEKLNIFEKFFYWLTSLF